MNDFESYYDILEVSRTATRDEIKRAFHRLANEYHPDKNTGATEKVRKMGEEKFKEINEAYGVLSDSKKKKQYESKLKEFEDKEQVAKSATQASTTGANAKTQATPVARKRLSGKQIFWIVIIGIFVLVEIISGWGGTNTNTSPDATPVVPIVSQPQFVATTSAPTNTPTTEEPSAQKDSYTNNTPVVSPKTNDQICESRYGTHSYSTDVRDASNNLTCDCESGYLWNSTNTVCIPKPDYTDVSLGSGTVTKDNMGFSFTWSTIGQEIKAYSDWGFGYYDKTTSGNFAVVNLSINNTALSNSSISVWNFSLTDNAGRVYYPSKEIFCD